MKYPFLFLCLALCCALVPACNLLDSDSDSDNDSDNDPQVTDLFEWVTVPAGGYSYGDSAKASTIGYDYQIMKYEVTNAQYVAYLEEALAAEEVRLNYNALEIADGVWGEYEGDELFYPQEAAYLYMYEYAQDPSYEDRITYSDGSFVIASGYEDHPVVNLSWFGAHAFATHYGLSLPTEQEWEKAARGNTGSVYPWGNTEPWDEEHNVDCTIVTYSGCGGGTAPVGSTTGISRYGAYDMAGNVYEWCHSWHAEGSYPRVKRGGAWTDGPYWTAQIFTYTRSSDQPVAHKWDIGFRCVKKD